MSDFTAIKKLCYDANMKLPNLGLVIFTFGNVSVADRQKRVFAIKPSGIPYDELREDDIVVVDYQANLVEGRLRPSSDTKTHAVLYGHWSEIGAIAHTHSTYATAWAQAQIDIPILGTTHADHLSVDVPCAPVMMDDKIEGDYERETGYQILSEFEKRNLDYREIQMILLGNHAPFTWGKTVDQAVYNSAILEEIAKMAYLTRSIRPGVGKMKDMLIQKHYRRKHGKNAYYGQD